MTIFETIRWLVKEYHRLARKIDGIRGPGVTNTRDTLAFNFPKGGGKRTPEPDGGTPTVLNIKASATRYGVYEAVTGTLDFTTLDPDTLTDTDISAFFTADAATFNAYFVNELEDGLSTHDLTIQDYVEGFRRGAIDGIPVYYGRRAHVNCT